MLATVATITKSAKITITYFGAYTGLCEAGGIAHSDEDKWICVYNTASAAIQNLFASLKPDQ